MIDRLRELGTRMNDSQPVLAARDSDIPSGYTYLGQLIAHEITSDKTRLLDAVAAPGNWRSPQIELDSLYGQRPGEPANRDFYEDDGMSLRVGQTEKSKSLNKDFPNDVLRRPDKTAIIGDDRNDENLPLAQTHLAFIKFHNQVVKKLPATLPPAERLAEARKQVVQLFHWIILNDYLPRLIDEQILKDVRRQRRWFTVSSANDLFIPLEFSAAAFRIGHSMVRPVYNWNHYHGDLFAQAELGNLFTQTRFSSDMSNQQSLLSEWIIDWRRFYDFSGLPYAPAPRNFARRIDTAFDLHLEKIAGYPHQGLTNECRSITVRNLLRGFALALPSGEQVACCMKLPALQPDEIAAGRYHDLLATGPLQGQTPLWFYILREAEIEAERKGSNYLGPVGSRILAETLCGLIENSPDSIATQTGWRPSADFSVRKTDSGSVRFEMADLLHFADTVDPIGRHLKLYTEA